MALVDPYFDDLWIQAKMPITPARSPIASIHMAAMNQQRRTNPHEAFSLFDVS